MSDDVKRYDDAVKWLKISYGHNNNNAAFALAKILSDESTELTDYKSANDWLERAKTGAEKILLERLKEQSIDIEPHSLTDWIDSAEQSLDLQGDCMACDETDVTETFLQLVSESRLSEAEYKLGRLFLKDEYLNYELAENHLRRAAVLQNPYTMYSLAKLYLKGDIPKNHTEAFRLLERAKELDDSISPLADYTIGAAYMFDDDIRDRELAEKYLKLSAGAGNEFAQDLLDKSAAWQRNSMIRLLSSIYNTLAVGARDGEQGLTAAGEAIFGHGDLSREAIAELIYKLQDKQNTAEM